MFPPKPAPTVELLNLTQNYAVFAGGLTLPITDYFDAAGDNCEAIEAIVCIAGDDAHGWYTIEIGAPAERMVLH